MAALEELAATEPEWQLNEYNIPAPPGYCGDYKCACARKPACS